MHEIRESALGRGALELADPERLLGGLGRRVGELALAQPRLQRAGHGHRRGPDQPGGQAAADIAGDRPDHAGTASGACATRVSSRSIRWSPTRSAFAIAVSAGLTELLDGKKLVSTTYRLSSSCALQSRSSADVAGSVPKRTVPHW